MRLALELHSRDLVEKIYPVFIGDRVSGSSSPDSSSKSVTSLADTNPVSANDAYAHYFKTGCHPQFSNDDVVASVESQVRTHLERMCLGCPLLDEMSTAAVLKAVIKSQGHVVDGAIGSAFSKVHQDILKMQIQHDQLLQKEQQQMKRQQFAQQLNSQSSNYSTQKPLRSVDFSVKGAGHPKDLMSSPIASSSLSSDLLVENQSSMRIGRQAEDARDAKVAVLFSYLQECGLRRSKCRQYAQKLLLQFNVDSPKILLRMFDNNRLMNILNSVMDRNDAEIVSKEIFSQRKSGKIYLY